MRTIILSIVMLITIGCNPVSERAKERYVREHPDTTSPTDQGFVIDHSE